MGKVAPSLLSADFSKSAEWLPICEQEADALHWDFMDEKYVPAKGVDQSQLAKLREQTRMPFDVHLMVEAPERLIEKAADDGADWLSFHLEASRKPSSAVQAAIDCGTRFGLAVNNQRDAEEVLPFFNKIDFVVVMTVEAGAGGQQFIEANLEKVKFLRRRIDQEGLDIDIHVDGGINLETGVKTVRAGADMLIAGNSIFGADDMRKAIQELKEIKL